MIAILGDRAAGDLDTTLTQNVDDRLIGEGMLGIFFLNELLELRLDPSRANVLAVGSGKARREKEFER